MPCLTNGPVTLCGPGRTKVIDEQHLGIRWCFTCRSRAEFTYQVVAEVEPSYYGLTTRIVCPSGHVDGDVFPGHTRDRGDY